jgi:hypothetical protein
MEELQNLNLELKNSWSKLATRVVAQLVDLVYQWGYFMTIESTI